jgi:beta-N-acetylhexosaminidase
LWRFSKQEARLKDGSNCQITNRITLNMSYKVLKIGQKNSLLSSIFLKAVLLLLMTLVTSNHSNAQTRLSQEAWVDSVYNHLTLYERIGQLFMVRAYSRGDINESEKIKNLIYNNNIGGVCFFQGIPEKQVQLTNQYQSMSKVPLMIAMDAEWGMGMRFPDRAMNFPKQLTLGAIQDNNLIYEFGKEVAEQCKRMGVHINFAPVADINNNPNNPVINDRSFGENKNNVAAKSIAYFKGLQENGVMACGKHFPGHGDTDIDSHYDLPVIHHDMKRLENMELYPFREMITAGVDAFMIAHLHIPAIDNRENRATTLSQKAVDELLRKKMKFNGLIITDALDMKGVSKHFKSGELELEAFLAGNDILLLSEDVFKAQKLISDKITSGEIKKSFLEASVKRILRAKYKYVIHQSKILDESKVTEFLNRPEAHSIKSKLIENAITLVSNKSDVVPFKNINGKIFLTIAIGTPKKNEFQHRIDNYALAKHYNASKEISREKYHEITNALKIADHVIVSLHDLGKSPKNNFGITPSAIELIKDIQKQSNMVLCVFGSPYSLKNFEDIETMVLAYEDDALTRDITAQSLFGAHDIKGHLPVSASENMKEGMGILKPSLGRLGFAIPERMKVSSQKLMLIDSIAEEIISKQAAPGCQILVAKDGKVVWNKAYGYFDYEKKNPVTTEALYDIASITKILAGTFSTMYLYDQKKLDIHQPLSHYLPELADEKIGNVHLDKLLSHYGGLKAYIPFYKQTLLSEKGNHSINPTYYTARRTEEFGLPVAKRLFMRTDFADTIFEQIYKSDIRPFSKYLYSDLGFIIIPKIIERITGEKFDLLLDTVFYRSLGMQKTAFNPLLRFPAQNIVPSEKDDYWRMQIVQGTVHDMTAAMLGGVSGHAGLFSNSLDLAIAMQMLLNGGTYGGVRYFDSKTIETFTSRAKYSSRRALGFDMKELNSHNSRNMGDKASSLSFGHLGFTGTCVFVDPVHNLIYVFLSNRTYPTMENKKLQKEEYRKVIHDYIYAALL